MSRRITVAMMIAMLASVTVSMGELTTGDVSLIFFVRCVVRLTCKSGCVNWQFVQRC